MVNHVIRFELLSALLHSNLCCSGLTIFCRNLSEQFCQGLPLTFFIAPIHTWLQIYSRFTSFLTSLHSISRRRLACIIASLDQIFRQSFIRTLLSFFTKLSRVCQLHQKSSCWLRRLVGYHQVRILLSESHVLRNSAPFRSTNIIQQ